MGRDRGRAPPGVAWPADRHDPSRFGRALRVDALLCAEAERPLAPGRYRPSDPCYARPRCARRRPPEIRARRRGRAEPRPGRAGTSARSRSSPPGRACTRCSPTGSRTPLQGRVPLLPRLIATVARSLTGIEIHPAAKIGHGPFIDHGMGVVIGETAKIGDDVTLYQGVTLGGTGLCDRQAPSDREDNVTIGSGAKLLGPDHGRARLEDRRQQRRRSTTCRRTRPSSECPVTRSGSRAGAPRARTPTGCTCPTRSPTRSRVSRAGSRRSSTRSGRLPVGLARTATASRRRPTEPKLGPNPAGG